MSVKYALLGILSERSRHGYELKSAFDERVGHRVTGRPCLGEAVEQRVAGGAGFGGRGHDELLSSSSALSLRRHRIRVGPMLPTGMPRSRAIPA